MKKILSLLFTTVLCLVLVSCGENNDTNSNENSQTNSSSIQQNSEVEQNRDDRYAEGINPDDVDFSQYTGVWYSKSEDKKIEFFEDGRIIFNDDTEYKWNNYDYKKRVSIYLGDKYVGYGYLNEKTGNFEMATPEDQTLIGPYSREK